MTIIGTPASPYYSPFVGAGGFPTHHDDNLLNPCAHSNIPILLTAFLAILATGGPTYSFGVYAATLKDTLELTQSQLETLGAASFAAGFISWIPGLFVDYWGPRKSLTIGGFLQSCGLFTYWIVSRFAYPFLPPNTWVPILSTLSMLIFTSNNLVIGGVFKSIVVSCGLGTKGKAVGAAKAYLGLGAGVFSSLFHAAWSTTTLTGSAENDNLNMDTTTTNVVHSDLDFLAMSAMLAILAIVVPALIALPTKDAMEKEGTKDDSTEQHYNVVYAGLGVLGTVVIGSSVATLFQPATANGVNDTASSSSSSSFVVPDWLHGLIILLAWIGPIVALLIVPTKTAKRKQFRKSHSSIRHQYRKAMEQDHPNEKKHLLVKPPIAVIAAGNGKTQKFVDTTKSSKLVVVENIEDGEEDDIPSDDEDSVICETPQPVKDLTLTEMLQTATAWTFLGVSTILVGSGTMLTINMGQMTQSLGFPPQTASACLAIFSVSQAVARVMSGAVSESALQWKTKLFGIRGVPRPTFLVMSCAFAVSGHAVLTIASNNLFLFVVGIMLIGFSFGGLWPLMVLIIGDLFGTVNHGANYMFADGFTCAVGTLSIAKFLTQFIYEQRIRDSEVTVCLGEECFRTTHIIISSLCFVSFVASTILLYTTRSSYGTILN